MTTSDQSVGLNRDNLKSSRSRRRERRKEGRNSSNDSKSVRRRDSTDDAKNDLKKSGPRRRPSVSSVISSDSSTSCRSPDPKRQLLDNNGGAKRKTRSRKRKLPKKAAKDKPVVVEVDDISDEEKKNYVAIDCEMVGVGRYGRRSALARVSITDWEGDVLLDKYVKVNEPVTDFRTFVSGITEADLDSDDAVEFEECQELVKGILRDRVLVGHALKNDFYALKLSHPWYMIRDTARYEPFMKADPTDKDSLVAKKLKDLARDKLGMTIQEEGKHHDSIEDATAAMELYKKARRKWDKAVEWKLNKTNSIREQQEKQE